MPTAINLVYYINFLTVRNFIIANIFVRNAHRSIVLYNFTVSEYQNRSEQDSLIVIHVKNHKTNRSQGLASVIVDAEFFHLMQFYIFMRNEVVKYKNSDCSFFFVSPGDTTGCISYDPFATNIPKKTKHQETYYCNNLQKECSLLGPG